MGIAFRPRAFQLQARSGGAGGEPPELAFLREYGVPDVHLKKARRVADRLGVDPVEALIADGGVTDTLYYKSLAHLVDVPFRLDGMLLDPSTRSLQALRDGRVKLADGTHLLAPTGRSIRCLVAGAKTPDLVPRGIAITTPGHLETLILRRAGEPIAKRASLALPSLRPKLSARGAADRRAAAIAVAVVAAALLAYVTVPSLLAVGAGSLFLVAVALRWIACAVGVQPSVAVPPAVSDRALPRYSVLVPLNREAGMVPGLVGHLARLDYPAAKLEILFLVEADDRSTLASLAAMSKPAFMRTVIVPLGEPRTKPRALNVGLALAKGELVTVYDAEDQPEPSQLRKAAARYAAAPDNLACLQARLAIADGNLLQRLFALEYRVLFGLYDTGLARLGLPLPLGGTSNHFRASALRDVGGWDAWNVTEDADLGVRLVRFGYAVDMLDSRTWEEAPARLDVWIKQRRRWTKGWMQVALVLLRDRSTVRDLGLGRAAAVALMLVGMVVGPLATPLVLALAAWQAWRGDWLGHASTGVALVVPAFAIVATLWCGWAAPRVHTFRGQSLLPLLLLPNQLLIAIAAWGGLLDLVWAPYHWRKTPHGAEALNRSSRAAPPPRRTACPPARRG